MFSTRLLSRFALILISKHIFSPRVFEVCKETERWRLFPASLGNRFSLNSDAESYPNKHLDCQGDYIIEVAYYAGKQGEKKSKQRLAVLITVA